MKVIVPLAGSDFVRSDGSVKAEVLFDGIPLLRRALESRSWWRNGLVDAHDLIFVLRDKPSTRRFASERLLTWYHGARVAYISEYTRGAAMSALAGCALIADLQDTVCIDLADILFEDEVLPEVLLSEPSTGGVALTFPSDKAIYSYLRRDADGAIVEAAEKKVISNEASAGVYFFSSASIYMKALSYILERGDAFTYNNLYFVCPVFNGVIAQGLMVKGVAVSNVQDVKIQNIA